MTHDDLMQQFDLLRTDPERYLALCNEYVQQCPSDPGAYFSRNQALNRLGQKELALKDLDKSLALEDNGTVRLARAELLARLDRYRDAIEEFDRAEAMYRQTFADHGAAQYRAYCHAKLGDEESALADCALLPDDHWLPTIRGLPGGTKDELIATMREIAAAARQGRDESQTGG
jgi:tetratricopeptide (TPR) repeat protein